MFEGIAIGLQNQGIIHHRGRHHNSYEPLLEFSVAQPYASKTTDYGDGTCGQRLRKIGRAV
ncbi:hypothetical protein GCM10007052_00520 [Halioglobus japonicus]|nr:hypothetical protein GCM10007052_00520 [Halioglobus japonicus]